MKKQNIVISAIVLTISGLFYYSLFISPNNVTNEPFNGIKGIAPFEGSANNMTFESYANILSSNDEVSIYLPTNLPKELSPVITWSKLDDKGNPYHTILVYDSKEDNKTTSADIVVEITIAENLSLEEDKNLKKIEINGWDAIYADDAPCAWLDYQEKYGTTKSIVVEVHIDKHNYWFRASTDYTVTDVIDIIESMETI